MSNSIRLCSDLPIGQQSFGPACPVCLHEPVSIEDCRPNKALRTTVKVFVKKRNHEKQESARRRIAGNANNAPASATPAEEEGAPQVASRSQTAHPIDDNAFGSGANDTPTDTLDPNSINDDRNGRPAPLEAQQDIPRPSIEVSLK